MAKSTLKNSGKGKGAVAAAPVPAALTEPTPVNPSPDVTNFPVDPLNPVPPAVVDNGPVIEVDFQTLTAADDAQQASESDAGPSDDVIVETILACEKRAKGHGLDPDRELLASVALLLRRLINVGADEVIGPKPGPYAPVAFAPPIGHSLPDLK